MAETLEDHAVIDIEKPLPSSFENLMADEKNSSPTCIFRTPTILSRHNEQAYKPKAFSFGPFHYGSQQSKSTQKIKLKYLKDLLSRSRSPEELYTKIIENVRSIQKEAREYYAGSIESRKEEVFLDILVLDGCFIIELFRKVAGEVFIDLDDPIRSIASLKEFLYHDLILLENQIPWLVLEHLFNLTKLREDENLIQLALDYFGNIFSSTRPPNIPNLLEGLQIKHILDLLRYSLVLPSEVAPYKYYSSGISVWEPLPCATEIYESGSLRKACTENVLGIRFSNGVLQIPPLLVHETTETVFRNLISYEQCCPNYEPFVTSYAKFMDNLIDTDNDVQILCQNGILDNWLNTQQVKNIFNNLYNDAYVRNFHYANICQQVNNHRRHWRTRLHYFYMHNYFGKPLGIVSQIAAIILLFLSFLQTYYSILGFIEGK